MAHNPHEADPRPCEHLDWDSAFWGVSVARVCGDTMDPARLRQIDAQCRDEDVACLYFLARADDPLTTSVAEGGDFHLMDARLTFRYRIAKNEGSTTNAESACHVRLCQPEDVPQLREIAGSSHQSTRFYFDPRVPPERCVELYETWIARSCEGFADAVLVAVRDQEPVGYISVHLPTMADGVGQIGLAGVSADARGQAIGRSLVTEALDWYAKAGVAEIIVVAQGRNAAAQRLFQRSGFDAQQLQLWYYKWYLAATTGRMRV